MKKNFSITLSALLCAMCPLVAQGVQSAPKSEQINPIETQLGKEAVTVIRQAYAAGKYDSFLQEMEEAYQAADEKGRLADLAQFRQGPAEERGEWTSRVQELQSEKNKELLGTLTDEDHSLLAEKIRSATKKNPELDAAFARLAAFRHMAPGSGKNSDENKLIDLDLKYEFKALHLDRPLVKGEALPLDQKEKHYVLKMEKMDEMVQLANAFEDASLKNAVELASSHFDEEMARRWDAADLSALAKTKGKTQLEQRAISVLSHYQEKMAELSK